MSSKIRKIRLATTIGTISIAAVMMFGGMAGSATAGEIINTMAACGQAAAQGKSIIMHVRANWCPTCAKQDKIIESLMSEPEFKDVVVFNIDYDTDKKLVEMLGVTTQSTLIANKGKRQIDRTAGITDPEAIRQFIRKSL